VTVPAERTKAKEAAVIHIVTYDLHNPGRDYAKVEKVLKSADGGWAHPQGSVWLIDTTQDPDWWCDRLKAAGDANDEYFVARLRQHWASYNMDKDCIDWLKSPSRRW
jgi:hypothetical protein